MLVNLHSSHYMFCRPWLITEKTSIRDTLRASIGTLVLRSEVSFSPVFLALGYWVVSTLMLPNINHEILILCITIFHFRDLIFMQKILQTTNIRTTNELKVVYSGTNEYRIAKQRRDLYKEFFDHQQRLHKRLVFEEEKILQL